MPSTPTYDQDWRNLTPRPDWGILASQDRLLSIKPLLYGESTVSLGVYAVTMWIVYLAPFWHCWPAPEWRALGVGRPETTVTLGLQSLALRHNRLGANSVILGVFLHFPWDACILAPGQSLRIKHGKCQFKINVRI
jgi:hypothetical protein